MKLETSSPHEEYEKAKEDVFTEHVALKDEKRRRVEIINGFKKAIKENPILILSIIDLLPPNLDILLAKRRLHSAKKKVSGLENEAHEEAIELNEKYEELKDEVVKAEKNFKEVLQKLADFETDSLGMNNKMDEQKE